MPPMPVKIGERLTSKTSLEIVFTTQSELFHSGFFSPINLNVNTFPNPSAKTKIHAVTNSMKKGNKLF